MPDRLDAEPPAGLTLLTPAALFATLNPVDKLWLITSFVWTAFMISTVSTIVLSYRKLKICNFACCLEWKNKNLTKRILFIYLLASSFASWNMACCVSTTASGLSDAGARVVLSVLRSEQKGGSINCLFYSVELVSPV